MTAGLLCGVWQLAGMVAGQASPLQRTHCCSLPHGTVQPAVPAAPREQPLGVQVCLGAGSKSNGLSLLLGCLVGWVRASGKPMSAGCPSLRHAGWEQLCVSFSALAGQGPAAEAGPRVCPPRRRGAGGGRAGRVEGGHRDRLQPRVRISCKGLRSCDSASPTLPASLHACLPVNRKHWCGRTKCRHLDYVVLRPVCLLSCLAPLGMCLPSLLPMPVQQVHHHL